MACMAMWIPIMVEILMRKRHLRNICFVLKSPLKLKVYIARGSNSIYYLGRVHDNNKGFSRSLINRRDVFLLFLAIAKVPYIWL